MKDKKGFGTFIKEKRIQKNYSQKDLAELLFVSESAVSKWERGVSYPDITLISDICKVLDISEKELIQSSDDSEYRKIKSNSDKFNKIKKGLFLSINVCYIIAILVCFIVNLAVNHTLSWFFIVLTSILVAYSFCPTITWINIKYKKLLFIGSTFISMFLLFLTCSIYTNNYWFMIATTGVLLLYFIIFYPILFVSQKKYLQDEKYKKLSKYFVLSYSLIILLLIWLLLLCIYCYSRFNILNGLIIAGGCMLIPILYGIIMLIDNQKKITKIVSFSLLGLVIIYIIVGLGRAFYLKSTEEVKTYVIEESFNNINIDVTTDDINIYLSDENKIVCVENKKVSLESKVVSDTLFINRMDNRKFYDLSFNFNSFKIDLYLSYETIQSLNIECSTGNINIQNGFTFTNVDISSSTGSININSNVTNNLFLDNDTGNIKISNCDKMGNIDIDTDTGNISLSNVNANKLEIETDTGDIRLTNTILKEDLNIEGSTGSVYFDGFDAANIYIELSTGDVKGTILSNKFFVAKSNTGKVIVPQTRDGGECIIIVDTGDINIKYK